MLSLRVGSPIKALGIQQHEGHEVGDRGSEADADDLLGELQEDGENAFVMQESFPSEADLG